MTGLASCSGARCFAGALKARNEFLGVLRSIELGPARARSISGGGASLILGFSVLPPLGGVCGLWNPWGSYGSPRDIVVPDDCAVVADVEVDEAGAPDVGKVDVLGVLMDWVTETLVGDDVLTTGDRVW